MIIKRNSIRLLQHHIDGFDLGATEPNHKDPSLLSPLVDNNDHQAAKTDKIAENESELPSTQHNNRCNHRMDKRRVRFDMSLNELHYVEQLTGHEVDQCWYGVKETKGFRKTAAQVGKQAMLAAPANDPKSSFKAILCQLLIEANKRGEDCSDNYDSTQLGEPQALSEWEESYVRLMLQKPDLLGLERFALDSITKDKGRRRREQFVALQQYLASPSSCSLLMDTNTAFALSTCERISRPSRLLSQRLAQIQAAHM